MSQTIQLENLRHSVFFRNVSHNVLEEVSTHCEFITLEAGDILFGQDSESDALYFLEDGEVQVIRRYPEGYDVILATEKPPYVIGEISMLANQTRTGRVIATQDCRLIKLTRTNIWKICESAPPIALEALRNLGVRLYRLNLRVRENAVSNISARVASLLLLLTENHAPIKNDAEAIAHIARASAANVDIVRRLLKQWVEYDLIDMDDNGITVKQSDALRIIAG